MITYAEASLLRSSVRAWLGVALVGSFGLGAALILWHAAYNENPVANLMSSALYAEQQALILEP